MAYKDRHSKPAYRERKGRHSSSGSAKRGADVRVGAGRNSNRSGKTLRGDYVPSAKTRARTQRSTSSHTQQCAASTRRATHTPSSKPKKQRARLGKRLAMSAAAVAALGIICAPFASPSSTIAEEPSTTQRSTLANLMSMAQFQTLEAKYKATLGEGQAIDREDYIAATNSSTLTPIAKPKVKGIAQDGEGTIVSWSKSTGAQGYDVYRNLDGEVWEQIAALDARARCYHDTDVEAGADYRYAIVATTEQDGYSNSDNSKVEHYIFLESPRVKVSKEKTHAVITWKSAAKATGYTVQYAANRFFIGAKTLTIDEGSTTSAYVSGLDRDARCYVRIRAVRVKSSSSSGDSSAASRASQAPWSYSSNVKGDVTATLSQIKVTKKAKAKAKKGAPKKKKIVYKKKRVAFELRRKAHQKVGGYDTLQGSCEAGGYAYYALNNRDLGKSKIVKVRLSTMKVVKVSKALNIHHANDMTVNTKEGYLVVNHSSGDPLGVSIVNMKTLKVARQIEIPKRVSGLFNASEAKDGAGIKSIRGISSIAYSAARDCYVASIWSTHDIVELDASFKPVRIIALSEKSSGMYQNIAVSNDVIVVSTAANSEQGSNYLYCYDWDGELLSRISLPNSTELESVFFTGSRMHANFYESGEQTKTKTVTETQYTTNAAGKAVAKKVKRKVSYTAVTRDNYCFKVKGI